MESSLTPFLSSVGGVPIHPLVVHAAVILVPLSALLALPVALRATWRRRFGWPVVIVAVLAWPAIPASVMSGRELAEDTYGAELGGLIAEHERLGEQLPLISGLFVLATVLLVALGTLGDRWWLTAPSDSGAAGQTPPWWRLGLAALAVAVVGMGIWTVVQVTLVGHLGAESTWGHLVGN